MVTRKLIGNQASRFRICHQIPDRKYGSAILGVSGLELRPFKQKWAGWHIECSEWISGNSSRHHTGYSGEQLSSRPITDYTLLYKHVYSAIVRCQHRLTGRA